MKHFLRITINEKGVRRGECPGDYRAFLEWGDSETMLRYQIRGYGDTPGAAADDAYAKWMEDPDVYAEQDGPEVWEE